MQVTGFYIQAAVVLNEHEAMMEALRRILKHTGPDSYIGRLASNAIPINM